MTEQSNLENIKPEQIVGGVFVISDDAEGFVPVEYQEGSEYVDDAGFRIDELSDSEGNVRASVLTIAPGVRTPAWHIKQIPETYGYIEHTMVTEGSGQIVVKPLPEDTASTDSQADTAGMQHLDVQSAIKDIDSDSGTIMVKPGETFQVQAGEQGIQLLTVFTRKPFELANEERVSDIFS